MSDAAMKNMRSRCACGGVEFEAIGAPITSAICYCASCQKAGSEFERLPGAPPVLDADGGTAVVLYRKDRVRFIQGREYLTEHRLEPESPTCRVVATCCNSAMFLNFTKGHWLSMYRNRFPPGAPKIEMRVMTRNRRASVALADDAPSYPGHSVKFIVKLLAAWVAMRFRSPKFHLGRNRVDSTRGDAAK